MTDTEDFKLEPKIRLAAAAEELLKEIEVLTKLVNNAFLSGHILDWPIGLGLPDGWVEDNHCGDPPARQIRKL